MQQQDDPASEGGTSFMRKPAAAVVAGINTEEVFVPTIPKNDATLAMLENAVKGVSPELQDGAHCMSFPA